MALVLVVDDDLPTCHMVGRVLEAEGYQVALCTKGVYCYPRVRELQPDLVILDLKMPELSGVEVLRFIRSDQKLKHIPVLLYSASIREFQSVDPSLLEQRVALLEKPFSIDELLQKIDHLTSTTKPSQPV